jgi:integrase
MGTKLGRKFRRRSFFDSEQKARAQAHDWNEEYNQGGKRSYIMPELRLDAMNARKALDAHGIKDTLLEAVDFYIKRKYPAAGDPFLPDLVKLFIDDKRREQKLWNKLRDVYFFSFNRFKGLADHFKDRRVSTLTEKDIIDWLYSQTALAPISKHHHFKYYRMLFEWGVKNGQVGENPLGKIKIPEPLVLPKIFTIAEVESLLFHSWNHPDGRFFPYLVLGFFCGIRPHELSKLQWLDIVDDGTLVHIPTQKSKTSDLREIPIPFCARLMLYRYQTWHPQKPANRIVPYYFPGFKEDLRRFYRQPALKIVKWPHDVIRHTFASFFYRATRDTDQLRMRLGHSQTEMTLRHYLSLTQEDWFAYFSLNVHRDDKAEIAALLKSHTKKGVVDDAALKKDML